MISINLIDWRSQKQEILNYRFYVATGIGVAVSILLSMIIYFVIEGMIANEKDDIAYLTQETASVDVLIKKIKDLQEQKDSLIAKREMIEKLQSSRSFAVIIFDNIARVVPDGVVITEFSRTDNQLALVGYSLGSAGVSTLMLNVQRLKWVTNAKLSEIKQDTTGQNRASNNIDKDSKDSDKEQNQTPEQNRIGFKLTITVDPTAVSS